MSKDKYDGSIIKKLRKARGLTQKQLAEAASMNEVQLRSIENSRSNPKYETLKRIADALDVSYLYLTELQSAYDSKPKYDISGKPINEAAVVKSLREELAGELDELIDTYQPYSDSIEKSFETLNLEGMKKVSEYAKDLSGNPKYQNDK